MTTKISVPKVDVTINRKKQLGAFSLELGLVLLVVALLVAAAVVYYRDNIRKTSINENVTALQYIGSNARVKYGKSNLYAQATTANTVRSQVIPTGLRDGGAGVLTASNPFGGVITTAPQNLTGTADAMRITWPTIPPGQCSDIVSGAQGEFRQVIVAATVVKPIDGVINLTTLETACDVAAPVTATFDVGRS